MSKFHVYVTNRLHRCCAGCWRRDLLVTKDMLVTLPILSLVMCQLRKTSQIFVDILRLLPLFKDKVDWATSELSFVPPEIERTSFCATNLTSTIFLNFKILLNRFERYSGLLKIRTPKNPDFCVFAKLDLSEKSGLLFSRQTGLVLKIWTYDLADMEFFKILGAEGHFLYFLTLVKRFFQTLSIDQTLDQRISPFGGSRWLRLIANK